MDLAINGAEPVRRQAYPRWPHGGERERELLAEVLASGNWDSRYGAFVRRFEEQFAAYQGARHAICVVNGEAALKIALRELQLPAGAEVIVPAYTFVATATAALQCGLTPVFADVDSDSYGLSAAAAEVVVGPRTAAIMPVHIGGMPADMTAIMDLAERHGLAVIEDAAQAWGASVDGRRVGALGRTGAFSFHASKNLACGEGGAVLTNDDEVAAACRSLANNGRGASGERYRHVRLGSNMRMSEFHGAMLCAAFERYPDEYARRDANAHALIPELESIPGVRCQSVGARQGASAWHLLVLRLDRDAFARADKARIVEALVAEGIPATAGYETPAYAQPLFADHARVPSRSGECPVADHACASEAVWVRHQALLGAREDALDVARALGHVQRHASELARVGG